MKLLDERNGPDHDLPEPDGRVRTYVIASLPRTGSTLLCQGIWATGMAGAPKEYLNPMQIRDWGLRGGKKRNHFLIGPLQTLARIDVPTHLATVQRLRSSNGWFGIKIHRHHWEKHGEHLRPDRWVFITRRDHIAQAVSWARAKQTGRWASWQKESLPPVWSRRRIGSALADIERLERAWEAHFRERRIIPHRVEYEQLIQDFPGTVQGVLDYLGVPSPDALPMPSLRRQADELSAEWIRRYRSGLP